MELFSVDKSIRDNFIRKAAILEKNENLEFMIREWEWEDRLDDFEDVEYPTSSYTLFLFGSNKKNESVCLTITEFTPFYYIKIPQKWCEIDAKRFISIAFDKFWGKKYMKEAKVLKRKDAYGFSNNIEFKFVRIAFNNKKAFASSQWIFKKEIRGYETMQFPLYESNIDPMLVFMHLKNIEASGWIGVKRKYLTKTNDSRCQLNYTATWTNVEALQENSIPGLMTASFDIECFSHDGSFPIPNVPANEITMIGTSFQRIGNDEIYKTVIVNRECNAIPGVDIITCKNERDTIVEWISLLEKTDGETRACVRYVRFYRRRISDVE
jgi:DNA polymerase delta subunit 1